MSKDDVRGPACPLTGRTVAEELLHAVSLLATVRVAERDGVRYNDAEHRAYCDGWYRAIAQAVAVMDLALDRRRTRFAASRKESRCRPVVSRNSFGRSAPIAASPSRKRARPSSAPLSAPSATRRRSSPATR